MEFLAVICIPVNCAIIYFTGDGTFQKVGKSSWVKFLEDQNPERWTEVNIVWLSIGLEHILLLLKIVIASYISDVPHSVALSEKKRGKV